MGMVSDSHKSHWPDHVRGHVETGDAVALVAIKVQHELAFTEVADEAIGEGGLEFLIFIHPLLADELAVMHDNGPRRLQLFIAEQAGVIRLGMLGNRCKGI